MGEGESHTVNAVLFCEILTVANSCSHPMMPCLLARTLAGEERAVLIFADIVLEQLRDPQKAVTDGRALQPPQEHGKVIDGNGTVITMSYQSKQKGGRRGILHYFQSVLRGPQEKYSPLISAVASSYPAQDASVTVKTHNTVLKVKRKKTRRELNRAKFGHVMVEKLFKCKPGHVVQKVRQPGKCHCKRVGNSWPAERTAPKLSLNSNWVITQNRLTHHLGIFNKEVKSVDIERLLKEDQSHHCWQGNTKEPTTKPAEDAMEVTPLQGKEADSVAFVAPPSASTPNPKENGPQPAAESGCAGQLPTARGPPSCDVETGAQVSSATPQQAALVTDLAQKLIKTLNTHSAFPGQNLVQQTQQQLLDILVERHGGLPDNLRSTLRGKQDCNITASTMDITGLSRPSSSAINLLDESTIASKLSAPRDRLIEEVFLPQTDSVACEFPTHSTPVVANRLTYRKQDTNGFAGLRISADVPGSPGLPEIWPQEVTERTVLFHGLHDGACAVTTKHQAEQDPSFKHPRHQRSWLWKNSSHLETAEVSASIFKSPTVGKSPLGTEWALRTEPVKVLNQDMNESKLRVPASQKRMFSNAASPQFCSQMHKSSNSLAKIWEAYQDSPGVPHWETLSGEVQSPAGWNPGKEWRNRGEPLEDIYHVSHHKLSHLGMDFWGRLTAADGCGRKWERLDALPEGGDVGGKPDDRQNHSKRPAETRDISFEGTKMVLERTPKGYHVVQHPLNPHLCSSLQEEVSGCPGQYDRLYRPVELHSLSISPSHFAYQEAAGRWGRFHPRDLDRKCIPLHSSDAHKENSGILCTQPEESLVSEKAAQGHKAVIDKWPCSLLDAACMSAKGNRKLGEKSFNSYLNWNGTEAHLPLSFDYPQPKACPLPLSFYYPPSDAVEWNDSPLPSWCGVPQRSTWESTSPEPWVFPRMKLY
ncbi:uncharacterized protein si:dkey-250k15.4 [Heterodontus francisci]|uniref:uncharacterized protein si:dkey-250k15.4 n=1 Tax=Heterodontus francisci TaxID=7792 RepID=UPI00355AFF29